MGWCEQKVGQKSDSTEVKPKEQVVEMVGVGHGDSRWIHVPLRISKFYSEI